MSLTAVAIAELNEAATTFYEAALASPAGTRARAYLASRGLSAAAISRWRLGYAPAGGLDLARHLGLAGQGEAVLLEAGLLRSGARGAMDLLRDRLVLPIIDIDDQRIVGFGSRRLRDDDPSIPKYLNSPETMIFHKSEILFGMPNLREAEKEGSVLVVEGNIDMYALWDAGIHNVVAAAGTAFTAEHLALIAERVSRVTLVLDGDAAGRTAAGKALRLPGAGGLDMGVVTLTGAKDPAELIATGGRAAFEEAVAGRLGRWEALEQEVATLHPGEEAEDRIARKDAMVELIVAHATGTAQAEALFARSEVALELPTGVLSNEYGSAVVGDLAPIEELLLVALAADFEHREPYAEFLSLGKAARAQLARWRTLGRPLPSATLRLLARSAGADAEQVWASELRRSRPSLLLQMEAAYRGGSDPTRADRLRGLLANLNRTAAPTSSAG